MNSDPVAEAVQVLRQLPEDAQRMVVRAILDYAAGGDHEH